MRGEALSPVSSDDMLDSRMNADRCTTPSDEIMMSSLSPPARQTSSEHIHLLEPDQKQSAADSTRIVSDDTNNRGPLAPDASRLEKLWVWWKESALLVVALGLLVAIISILIAFGGKPLPKGILGLNLNTIVALLATSLRSSLMMVVEEVLSQAKWTWQHRLQPIIDLATFDEASRGPLGSLLLWFKITTPGKRSFLTRHTMSALLASIVTILSLAVGSFTQQAVKSIPCSIALQNSSASLALVSGPMYSMTIRPGGGDFRLNNAAIGRVFRALIGTSIDRSTIVQGCTTGSCTFPEVAPGVTHLTSGFCSKCLNTTNSVFEGRRSQYPENPSSCLHLPNELSVGPIGYASPLKILDASLGEMILRNDTNTTNASWSDKIMSSRPDYSEAWAASVAKVNILTLTTAGCSWSDFGGRFRDATGAVLYNYDCSYPWERNFTSAYRQMRWNVASASCILYPCVKELRASVENGRFDETTVNETPIYSPNPIRSANMVIGMIKTPCFIDGIRYDRQNFSLVPALGAMNGSERVKQKCFYDVPFDILSSIMQGTWLKDLLSGNCSMAINQGDTQEARSFALCQENSFSANKWWLSGLYNNGNATFATISATMDDVATALTDSMRLASVADDGLNENNTVNGTVWKADVCTEFSWRWLLFPLALIAFSVVSLVLMILSTAFSEDQIPVWKSSILPFLYLGNRKMHTMSLEEMERAARKGEAALQQNEAGGWHLVPGHEMRDDDSG